MPWLTRLFQSVYKYLLIKTLIIMSKTSMIDLKKELPDLNKAELADFQLGTDYWNPTEGEVKRVFFAGFEQQEVPNLNGEGTVTLRVALFVESVEGKKNMMCNGAMKLVSSLENHNIDKGTPLQITYLGKTKNKTNSYSSDSFQIIPLNI